MKIEQRQWRTGEGWTLAGKEVLSGKADLVLAFGGTGALDDDDALDALRVKYPDAHLVGCSTAGEILGTHVADGTIAATAIRFDHTQVRTAEVTIHQPQESRNAGRKLAARIDKNGLHHVLLISDGQHVNGSELARGVQEELPANVAVTGGLAGDGARFQRTLVFADHAPREDRVVAVAFYGPGLQVGYGSLGGWDPFGPQRIVTRSENNVLYELDGQPALDLYKRYLGEHASGLPATGLLFPLSIQATPHDRELVRTILSVNERDKSLTFAGDMPEGSYARLMKANFDRLVDGAHGAAANASLLHANPDLAILISCVGRKLVLKQRTEQELEAVRDVLGPQTAMTGFYSYGEICPVSPNANCELHNQTMTITTMTET
ncbi:MAG TPA: FIST N-terminal domain-containing protein [Candidatus Thermoplasmatota archaeon]|nr:FIST N-terminal domain-containing protein [Candidatus Thermoplasmatota archaeon]